jgi:L-2-hydroxycarboxylate dehydrogenase (NAD+)
MSKRIFYRFDDLRDYIIRVFTKYGVPAEDAATCADVLLAADLRGVDSHGIIRLYTYYADRLQQGMIDPRTPISTVQETGTSLALDAGMGLGQVAGRFAMARCIEKALAAGMAIVTVRNSNHYGIAAYYAMMALPHDMIGVSLTNAHPLVAPTYGRSAMLGTNPIAVAIPAARERPFVLDMATSIVSIGRVAVYEKAGETIPVGWGIDVQGEPTNSPSAVLHGGALMPLGGPDIFRGYKGYGLALLVDLLSGVLAGAAFGTDVGGPSETRPANVGHFFAAVRVDGFRPISEFKQDVDRIMAMMKNAPKASGQDRIYVHGEKEFERSECYLDTGIPLLEGVVQSLIQGGHESRVEFDLEAVDVTETEEEFGEVCF